MKLFLISLVASILAVIIYENWKARPRKGCGCESCQEKAYA